MAKAKLARELKTGGRHYPVGTEVTVGGQHDRVNNFKITFPDGHVMYLGSSWLSDVVGEKLILSVDPQVIHVDFERKAAGA